MTEADDRGIQHEWLDAHDQPHRVPDETVATLREVIGTPPPDLADRAPVVTRPGRRLGLGRVEVTCEDGSVRSVDDVLPDDFPLGYHRMRTASGRERRLVVSPGRCWLPQEQRWGWTVQLYAARSRESWGIGDLADLRTLCEWTRQLGGGFLLVNPLHAVPAVVPQEASPYLPATRRFRNPVYLRVQEVAGFDADRVPEPERRRLTDAPAIDRDGAWALKAAVLREVFDRTDAGSDPGFVAWRRERGRPLEEFATWSVLVARHGPDWHDWPTDLRRPDAPAVAEVAATAADDVTFHAWLQWELDRQLGEATDGLTVLQDLPIGVSGGGADAWTWQDVLADGVSVGAPPDLFNTQGQDWGSPPMVPWRLQEADYEPFIESVRETMAGTGGLRIDHVMGLFRLWWVPAGGSAADGAYVRYPSDDLLDIVALESHRARAVVVGEDLGTVEPSVGRALAERGILSYKLLWFEEDPPADWPAGALAAVTTHDLPTVAGLWSGSDVDDVLESTDMPAEDVRRGRADLMSRIDADPSADVATAVAAAYRQLAEAPCLLLGLALEDAVLEERRPNVPATVDRDNWRIPLPLSLEELVHSPDALRLARLVDEAVRNRAGAAASGRAASPWRP